MKIAMTMIVKNEADRIERCLESWWGHVDYAVIADTGSTDDTKKLIQRYAVDHPETALRLVDFEWCENFSKARQAAQDAVPDDVTHTCWVDADDTIEGADKLRALAQNMPPDVAGTMHRYDYAQDEAGNCICELWRERLVRTDVGAEWKLPIHEVLHVPGNLARNTEVLWVHHPGEREGRDPERNYKILKADYDEAVDAGKTPDSRTLAYVGTELLALGRAEEAIPYFEQYLDLGLPGEENAQVNAKLSAALRFIDRLDDAVTYANKSIDQCPTWPDGYLALAEIALRREKPDVALQWISMAEQLPKPETLLIINPLEYEYAHVVMKSVALAKVGRVQEAMEATQRAIEMTPYRQDLHMQAFQLQQQMKSLEAQRLVLELREMLVRHDENWKAQKLMECVPYFVEQEPAVHHARLDQREMTLHAVDPDVYSRYYRENPNEAPFEQQGIEIPKAHEAFPRVNFLRKGLEEQRKLSGRKKLSVLDLSGNDGWMSVNIALAGHHVDMMEMNPEPVGRAKARQKDFKEWTGEVVCDDLHNAPKHFEEHSYDAVVLFETIEHVPYPEETIQAMLRMCHPEGRIYISTPNGAYENGNLPEWHRVESKGHLRAIPPEQLSDWLCKVGVIEGFELTQDNLIVAAVTPRTPKGRVEFFLGASDALPEAILQEGQGGSETAACKVAEHFAREGYDVRVYAGSGGGLRGDYVTVGLDKSDGQVLYEPWTMWDPGSEADLLIISRLPEALDRTIAAKKTVLWLHDAEYTGRVTPERISRVDEVLVMSEFQKKILCEAHPEIIDKVYVTRNGIETSWFQSPKSKRKDWVVFSSSPDRGLDVLLEVWPEVRERVPNAVLHHTYAPVYQKFAAVYPHLKDFHKKIEKLSDQEGVVAHGHMGQKALAELYCEAKVWAYPSWTGWSEKPFPEISCISAMEAQAAGACAVCAGYGALLETVKGGVFVPMDEEKGIDRQKFIEAIVTALKDGHTDLTELGREHALKLDWSGVVEDWEVRYLAAAATARATA